MQVFRYRIQNPTNIPFPLPQKHLLRVLCSNTYGIGSHFFWFYRAMLR